MKGSFLGLDLGDKLKELGKDLGKGLLEVTEPLRELIEPEVKEPTYTTLKKFSDFEIRRYNAYCTAEVSVNTEKERNNAFKKLASYIGVFGSPNNKGVRPMDMTAPVLNKDKPVSMDMTAPVLNKDKLNPVAMDMTAPVLNKDKPVSMDMTAPVLNKDKKSGVSMDMTAPVLNSDKHEKTMSFILPAKYQKLEDVPVPNDSSIKVSCTEPEVIAVRRFGGFMTKDMERDNREALYQSLKKNGFYKPNSKNSAATDEFYSAQYNSPWTAASHRRNEIWVIMNKNNEMVRKLSRSVNAEAN